MHSTDGRAALFRRLKDAQSGAASHRATHLEEARLPAPESVATMPMYLPNE